MTINMLQGYETLNGLGAFLHKSISKSTLHCISFGEKCFQMPSVQFVSKKPRLDGEK